MKALIAMSGGVDSSVAAYIMKEKEYDCIGVMMKLFQNEEVGVSSDSSCCSLDDAADARSVAYSMGMNFYVFNFADCFRKRVIDGFIESYENGFTPNPCIDCNRYLKFEKLFQRAKELGCEYVVTGHYARIDFDNESGRYLLKKAEDSTKDQSYVLYNLSQERLAHVKFPLGDMKKSDVRRIAEQQGFRNAHKGESQDICFVPDGDYASFIEGYTGKTYPEGDFIDAEGNVLGKHKGIVRYTIGQRRGLGIASTAKLYVTDIRPEDNTVVLSHGENLFHREVVLSDINLISVARIEGSMRVKAKLRYRQKEQLCTVMQEKDDSGSDILRIVFDEPQRAATKGQAAVIYDGDKVVGGGTITQVRS